MVWAQELEGSPSQRVLTRSHVAGVVLQLPTPSSTTSQGGLLALPLPWGSPCLRCSCWYDHMQLEPRSGCGRGTIPTVSCCSRCVLQFLHAVTLCVHAGCRHYAGCRTIDCRNWHLAGQSPSRSPMECPRSDVRRGQHAHCGVLGQPAVRQPNEAAIGRASFPPLLCPEGAVLSCPAQHSGCDPQLFQDALALVVHSLWLRQHPQSLLLSLVAIAIEVHILHSLLLSPAPASKAIVTAALVRTPSRRAHPCTSMHIHAHPCASMGRPCVPPVPRL